jgi:hypothetical protein
MDSAVIDRRYSSWDTTARVPPLFELPRRDAFDQVNVETLFHFVCAKS